MATDYKPRESQNTS